MVEASNAQALKPIDGLSDHSVRSVFGGLQGVIYAKVNVSFNDRRA
ncbi:hypothetical protein COUCH_25345 [Couchioplanes caeruleus]|nr:hypothetical protein [Couchioplanes caeruleus]UQU62351.1 hypothetical protein COUCH_25345 [Couchioplanes caeruleus]